MHTPPRTAQRDDEVFDVVDAEDRVIGRATRREVHARKLLHRATHVLVFNREGRVFLQKRSLLKDSAPGCWDSSCSGHLDAGEDYLAAAVRELAEEIGVCLPPEALVFRCQLPPSADTGWEFVRIFTARYDGPVTLNPAEIECGQWYAPEDVSAGIRERPQAYTKPLRQHWEQMRAAVQGDAR